MSLKQQIFCSLYDNQFFFNLTLGQNKIYCEIKTVFVKTFNLCPLFVIISLRSNYVLQIKSLIPFLTVESTNLRSFAI